MQQQIYDVIIIGAGPSGLSTALHLQKYQPSLTRNILVLEKAVFPRNKLCGGGLTIDAEVLLQNLDLDANELPNIISEKIIFKTRGYQFTFSSAADHSIRTIRRIDFDAWLMQKARQRGITVLEGCNVTDVSNQNNLVLIETVTTNYLARIAVLAEGSRGTLSRKLFSHRKVKKARLIEVVHPKADSPKIEKKQPSSVIDFSPILDGIDGYFWDFPSPGSEEPNTCLGLFDAHTHHNDSPSLPAYLRKTYPIESELITSDMLQGHPILLFDPKHCNQTGQVIVVGDCAGADPLFGEGISFALGSGQLAACEIVEAINNNFFRLKDYQQRIIRSPLGRSLYIRWAISNILFFFRGKFSQILVWKYLNPIVRYIATEHILGWAKKLRPPSEYL